MELGSSELQSAGNAHARDDDEEASPPGAKGSASLRPYRSARDREYRLPCNRQRLRDLPITMEKLLQMACPLKRIGRLIARRGPFPIGMNHIARSRLPRRQEMGDAAATSFKKGEDK
jgi:hypothetical protein